MTFALDLRKFAEKTETNIDTVRRKVALDLFTSIIRKTPVDTGRARGNWVATLNVPNSGVSSVSDKSGGGAISQSTGVVVSAKGDDSIWLVNNLPYIRRLEYGWSMQAPQGMLRLSVREYQRFIDKAVRSIK